MILEKGKILTNSEIDELEYLSTYSSYKIFWLNDDPGFIVAIDSTNLICSCFEFVERYDGNLLAHMHTIDKIKGKGIGSAILREAVSIYTVFNLPPTSDGIYYFIEDGYNWIQRRFDDGTLKEPPFKRPD